MSNLPHLSPAETETAESEWFRLARLARARQGGSSNKDLQREVGVAFSGGGIRSATFNLGVLQALSEMKKLKQVGYISSVSGGSNINTWLAGWIHRDRFHNVDQALAKHADASTVNNWVDEQQPVFHLRRYSSYLTPQRGFMSSDVWAAVAAYVLRLLPNAGFVLLAAIALVALPYIERDLYRLIAGFDVEQQAGAYRAGLVQ